MGSVLDTYHCHSVVVVGASVRSERGCIGAAMLLPIDVAPLRYNQKVAGRTGVVSWLSSETSRSICACRATGLA